MLDGLDGLILLTKWPAPSPSTSASIGTLPSFPNLHFGIEIYLPFFCKAAVEHCCPPHAKLLERYKANATPCTWLSTSNYFPSISNLINTMNKTRTDTPSPISKGVVCNRKEVRFRSLIALLPPRCIVYASVMNESNGGLTRMQLLLIIDMDQIQ